jgi:predicted DsbA family dithiol-disulfide isomerase
VEVFADITCPFAHVGLRRFVEHRARLDRADIVLRVRAWPLELVNGEPLAADAVAERVARIREQVAPDLFTGFDRGRFPSTSLPALRLVAAAYGRDERTGEHVSMALRTALFEEGLDVSEPTVLASIARCHALDPDPGPEAEADAERAVLSDWHEGIARGVLGSPHFFVGTRSHFCPMLDIRSVDEQLVVGVDASRLSAFVADVFGGLG